MRETVIVSAVRTPTGKRRPLGVMTVSWAEVSRIMSGYG